MPYVEAFSYKTFDAALVHAEEWQVGETGKQVVLPEIMTKWDPLTDLSFSRTADFDFPTMFAQCGLSSGAEIMVTASWHSAGTSLKEQAFTFVAHDSAPRQTVNFAFTLAGSKLAGRLTLLTRVLLGKRGRKTLPLTPAQVGAILWQDDRSTQLEGLGARFPIQFADFAELGFPVGAGWSLHWIRDFQAQFMGRVWLMINTRHERLRGIVSGSVTDPQAPAIFSAIHFDIARELITGGLESDEFIEQDGAFEPGSTGDAIRVLIRRVFGEETLESVRDLLRNDSERFDCFLQDGFKLFHASAAI